MKVSPTPHSSAAALVSRPRARSQFFFGLAVTMLGVVFLGFAPTFYLAPAFETPFDRRGMPFYLIVHAVFLTAWYGGVVVQAGWVGRGRGATRMALGWYVVGVGAAVVVTGALATLWAVPRAAELGTFSRPRLNTLVATNTLSLLVFVACVTAALLKRRKPQTHKRLMLIGSIAIIGPAVGPGRMLGGFLQSLLPEWMVAVPLVFWIVLVVPIFVYDVRTTGRVHPAAVWGVGAKAASVTITLVMVDMGVAASYVDWLERLQS